MGKITGTLVWLARQAITRRFKAKGRGNLRRAKAEAQPLRYCELHSPFLPLQLPAQSHRLPTYPAIPAIAIGVGSLPSAVQEPRAPSFENSTRTNKFFVCQNRALLNYVVQRRITLSTG